jgi:hypothetical protein
MLLRKLPSIIVLSALAQVSEAVAQTAPVPARPAAKEDPVQLPHVQVTTAKDIGYRSTDVTELTRVNAF